MKSISTLILLLVIFQTAYTQNAIQYSYDSAGNRTGRVHTSSTTANSDGVHPEELAPANLNQLVKETQLLASNEDKATKDNEQAVKFTIFPNPTTDKITLTTAGASVTKTASHTVLLLDAKGKIQDQITTQEEVVTFDLSHLAKGVYYVYFVGEKVKKAWKVVKE